MGTSGANDPFNASRAHFEQLCSFMGDDDSRGLTHGELEQRLGSAGRELLRQLLQDHLDLRTAREERLDEVIDHEGISHHAVEAGHQRMFTTVFGEVRVTRLAYRRRGHANDGQLSTSSASTRRAPRDRRTTRSFSCCRVTARASSCGPGHCARQRARLQQPAPPTQDPPVERRETQPQAHGRSGCRL